MGNKGKTILILGNGFDLAHGLPTKYSDFLNFCEKIEGIWNADLKEWGFEILLAKWDIHELIKKDMKEAFAQRKISGINSNKKVTCKNEKLNEIYEMTCGNIWYGYFRKLYRKKLIKGENWIDFESEIRYIIQQIDQKSTSLTDLLMDVLEGSVGKDGMYEDDIYNDKLIEFIQHLELILGANYEKMTIRNFRERAFEDLEHLIRALELYLAGFVEKIPIMKRIREISDITPDYVINFNYTDTYERKYLEEKGIIDKKVYHIHGKADERHLKEENNMVLGIDEYWSESEQDEQTNFTIFKKFAQRIQKHTGNESYKYLLEVQKIFKERGKIWSGNVDSSKVHADGVSHIYIFGHSLDVTDKDILSDLIGNDATAVTVYCRDKGTEGELIANTIKLIGQKRLLAKSNYIPTKLEYVIPKTDELYDIQEILSMSER